MKRRKIYYIPGLISLIGLPILFFFFPVEDPIQKCVVRLSIPSDRETYDSIDVFSKYYVKKTIEGKKIVTVDLSDLYDDSGFIPDSSKFNFIHSEIEVLEFTHDTSTVLKIELGDQNTYSDFMWLLNQCMIYVLKRYALVNDLLYIFPNPPPINHNTLNIEPIELDSLSLSTFKGSTNWDIFKWRLEYKLSYMFFLVKLNSTLCIGFFILILIPFIFAIRKTIKKGNQLLP